MDTLLEHSIKPWRLRDAGRSEGSGQRFRGTGRGFDRWWPPVDPMKSRMVYRSLRGVVGAALWLLAGYVLLLAYVERSVVELGAANAQIQLARARSVGAECSAPCVRDAQRMNAAIESMFESEVERAMAARTAYRRLALVGLLLAALGAWTLASLRPRASRQG